MSLPDSREAGLWCSTPTVCLELRSGFSSIGAKSLLCAVTARSSAYTKLCVPG